MTPDLNKIKSSTEKENNGKWRSALVMQQYNLLVVKINVRYPTWLLLYTESIIHAFGNLITILFSKN